MRAVAALPAGEISLVGRRARLTAEPPTRLRALTEARAALAENLPRNYRLAVIAAAPEGGVAGDDPSPAMSGAAETVLTFDGEEMVFSGAAPSEVLAEALVAFARARLRDVAVRNALTPAPDLAAGDWRAAAATLLSGLTRLTRGEARLTAGAARLEGETPEAREIPALHRFIRGGIGDGREVVTRIRVALAAKAAATPTPPGRCAARLNRIVEASPIRFEPNSTQINEASAPIVTRLAAALSDCAGGVIEIGGHTDSQGSARLNLGLSRSRAFAVLDALLATDVDPRLLTARGYGEEQPIADNGTEAGRARNRRIAFSVTRAQAADGGDGGDEQR